MAELEYKPESMAALKRRVARAFERVWTTADVTAGVDAPAKRAEHIFDTDEGHRITLSHDHADGEDPIYHACASVRPGSYLESLAVRGFRHAETGRWNKLVVAWFIGSAINVIKELTGRDDWKWIYSSPEKGVPHFTAPVTEGSNSN